MNKKHANNKNKIVFDEKIDDSINGFALVFSFIIIGIILQFDNSFFRVGTNFIKIAFIIIGILGLFTEISKLNKSFSIKGLDNIVIGTFLLIILYLLKNYINISKWWDIFTIIYELMLFFMILISIYGFCRGIIEMSYSIYKNHKEKNKKSNLFSSIIVILSQLLGLVLIIAQIYNILK